MRLELSSRDRTNQRKEAACATASGSLFNYAIAATSNNLQEMYQASKHCVLLISNFFLGNMPFDSLSSLQNIYTNLGISIACSALLANVNLEI
jgi:hypothetical protein